MVMGFTPTENAVSGLTFIHTYPQTRGESCGIITTYCHHTDACRFRGDVAADGILGWSFMGLVPTTSMDSGAGKLTGACIGTGKARLIVMGVFPDRRCRARTYTYTDNADANITIRWADSGQTGLYNRV
jgi:hypothetical protein